MERGTYQFVSFSERFKRLACLLSACAKGHKESYHYNRDSKETSKGKQVLELEQAFESVLNIVSKAPSTANAAVQAGSTLR